MCCPGEFYMGRKINIPTNVTNYPYHLNLVEVNYWILQLTDHSLFGDCIMITSRLDESLPRWKSVPLGFPAWNMLPVRPHYLHPDCIRRVQRMQAKIHVLYQHEVKYREPAKGLLRRTQTGPSRTVKQQQEQISPNHVQAIYGTSV